MEEQSFHTSPCRWLFLPVDPTCPGIYLTSHTGWQNCLSQHPGALAMSFLTAVKKISADIDEF